MSRVAKCRPSRWSTERWWVWMAAALAAALWLAAGAGARAGEPAEPSHEALVLPAHVVAYQAAVITAKVAGFVKAIPVDKGDRVKAGQLIAELEVPELAADRVKYRAQLDVAQRNYARIQQAAKAAPDLVTPEQVDRYRGRLEVAQAELDRVEALLRYARVTAPFSGTITARYVDPGAFVAVPTAGDPKGAAIVTLMSLSRVRVQIPVPERTAPSVRPGCPAVVSSVDLPGVRIPATITRVSYALSRRSQTMLAEIDMPNPGHQLLPGMYVSVQLSSTAPRAIAAATRKVAP
ncbi:MAG: efflux RND transporter periplasmic adaptor subunit [Steroidobacteraceae bacterium]